MSFLQIDIQPILNDVNVIMKKGIETVVHQHLHKYLTMELEKCQKELDYYKKELDSLQQSGTNENILLQIDELVNQQKVDSDCVVEQMLLTNEVRYKNVRIKLREEEEDKNAEEEEEEEDEDQYEEEEEEEEEEEDEEDEDQNEGQEEDEDQNEGQEEEEDQNEGQEEEVQDEGKDQ